MFVLCVEGLERMSMLGQNQQIGRASLAELFKIKLE